MTLLAEAESQSFVLLRLGDRRFAVAAREIAELVPPSRVFRFPHHTVEIEGVILRRGRVVPVCDVGEKLIGKKLTSRRFYLVAQRRFGTQSEWVALPVTGECELIHSEMTPPSPSDAPHVSGWLAHAGDVIEVLHLPALTPGPDSPAATSTAALQPQETRP